MDHRGLAMASGRMRVQILKKRKKKRKNCIDNWRLQATIYDNNFRIYGVPRYIRGLGNLSRDPCTVVHRWAGATRLDGQSDYMVLPSQGYEGLCNQTTPRGNSKYICGEF